MVIFKNCCCCISLRTGVLILCVISLVFALVTTTTSVLSIIQYTQDDGSPANHTILPAIEYEPRSLPWEILQLVNSLLSFTCSALAIYGTLKHRSYCLIPYLVSEFLQTVNIGSYIIYAIYAASTADPAISQEQITIEIISGVLGVALSAYFWACVYSLYKLDREERRTQLNRQYIHPQPHYPQVVYYTRGDGIY